LTVRDTLNQPPVLVPIGDHTVMQGEELTFTAVATDPDGPSQTLTYTLDSGGPAGASLDPATGRFSWSPADTPPGDYPVTARVPGPAPPASPASEPIGPPVVAGPRPAAGDADLSFGSGGAVPFSTENSAPDFGIAVVVLPDQEILVAAASQLN